MRPRRRARHRTGRAVALRPLAPLVRGRGEPQVDLRPAGPDRDRRQPSRSTCRWSAICAPSCRSWSARWATACPGRAPASIHEGRSRPSSTNWRSKPREDRRHRQRADEHRAVRRRGDQGLPQGRHHDPRRRRHGDLPVDLFAGQAARRDLEPELRPHRHRPALCDGRHARRPGRDRQGPPGHAADLDSSFLFHIGELEVAVRKNLPLVCVVGVDYPVGPRSRRLQAHLRPGHRRDRHALVRQGVRFDKIAEGFGCHGEYVDKADEIGPAIERAYASGEPA